jgi:hypothetical protein
MKFLNEYLKMSQSTKNEFKWIFIFHYKSMLKYTKHIVFMYKKTKKCDN